MTDVPSLSPEDRLYDSMFGSSARPLVMGIINTTPDSFFQKSRAFGHEALEKAMEQVRDGADIIDIGGESTRPGSDYVSAQEELERVLPLVEAIRKRSNVPISIDTRKAAVASASLQAGANVINDISALRDDPDLAGIIAESNAYVVLMHMQGTPRDMQLQPSYHDIVGEVKAFFEARIAVAQDAGIACEKIILDPGIGFGKLHGHNLTLLRELDELCSMGYPLLMGHSRKSFIARILALKAHENARPDDLGELPPPDERMIGSLAVAADSYMKGAKIFRVHDVKYTREVLDVLYAIARYQD